MLRNKTVAVVVPAYNEESQIQMVLSTMPSFVDRIIVINDNSNDKTEEVVKQYILTENESTSTKLEKSSDKIKSNQFNRADRVVQDLYEEEVKDLTPFEIVAGNIYEDRIVLINHKVNAGKGAGIVTGYKVSRDLGIDCVATMDGDGQMDPDELESICLPIIEDNIDYVKGNRLIHRSALLVIPKVRYIGNSILSILTKLASGYWRVSDSQTGYTAIGNKALNSIRIHEIYKKYGYPNDVLVKLNIAMCSIKEVEIKPVYDVGEKSKMKIWKIIPTLSWLLFKSFFKRLWLKYFFRDFHPLFLLYNLSFLLGFGTIAYGIKIVNYWLVGTVINPLTILAFSFLCISGFQSLLFAMWMDMQDNERLYK